MCVLYLHTEEKTSTQHYSSFPLVCVYSHEAFKCASLCTYRLNHSILDPPMAVLLLPGLLDNYSSSLFGCLSVELFWDQSGGTASQQFVFFQPEDSSQSPPVAEDRLSPSSAVMDLYLKLGNVDFCTKSEVILSLCTQLMVNRERLSEPPL